MIVIGVIVNRKIYKKTWQNVPKRYPFLYYYDEGSGKFNARRINKIQAILVQITQKKDV